MNENAKYTENNFENAAEMLAQLLVMQVDQEITNQNKEENGRPRLPEDTTEN